MKSYTDVRKEITEKLPTETVKRTDYRCAANGCPNAGCIDDEGEGHKGRCYFHWRESDAMKWPAITREIRETWPRMANWDPEKLARIAREDADAAARYAR